MAGCTDEPMRAGSSAISFARRLAALRSSLATTVPTRSSARSSAASSAVRAESSAAPVSSARSRSRRVRVASTRSAVQALPPARDRPRASGRCRRARAPCGGARTAPPRSTSRSATRPLSALSSFGSLFTQCPALRGLSESETTASASASTPAGGAPAGDEQEELLGEQQIWGGDRSRLLWQRLSLPKGLPPTRARKRQAIARSCAATSPVSGP